LCTRAGVNYLLQLNGSQWTITKNAEMKANLLALANTWTTTALRGQIFENCMLDGWAVMTGLASRVILSFSSFSFLGDPRVCRKKEKKKKTSERDL
jgi:hypothetical protein